MTVKIRYDYQSRSFDAPQIIAPVGSNSRNWILYLRVSSDKQQKQWHGMESQEDVCTKRAKDNWINILKIFRDEAISWVKEDRIWFVDSLKFIDTCQKQWQWIDFYICTEISRITRPEYLLEWVAIVSRIIERNMQLVDAISNQIISKEDDLQILFSMFKVLEAKNERKKIKERTTNWRISRTKAGYRTMRAPAWYKPSKETVNGRTNSIIEPLYPHCEYLKEAFELFADGRLYRKKDFLYFLEDKWFIGNGKSTTAKKLHRSVYERALYPINLYLYAGWILYPKRNIVEPIKAKHKAIISIETVHKILDRLSNKEAIRELTKWQRRNGLQNFPYKRVLRCGKCGKYLCWWFSTSRNLEKHPYYGCNNHLCELYKKSLPRQRVNQNIEKLLEWIYAKPQVVKLMEKLFESSVANKRNVMVNINKDRLETIDSIEIQKKQIEASLLTIDEPWIKDSFVSKWKDLNWQQNKLRSEVEQNWFDESKIVEPFRIVKDMLQNMASLRQIKNIELRNMILKVLFSDQLFIEKNQWCRTTDSSNLYQVFYSNKFPLCRFYWPRPESNRDYNLRRVMSYPLNDEIISITVNTVFRKYRKYRTKIFYNLFFSIYAFYVFYSFYESNFSKYLPKLNNLGSDHFWAISWIPVGIISHWSSTIPIGIDIAGNPHIFAGIVYISAKYTFNGSSVLEPIFQAASGTVGVKIMSYCANIVSNSACNSSLAFCALR